MTTEFHPIPWSEFLHECFYYLMFASLLQLAVFIFVCLILAIASEYSKEQRPFLGGRIARFAVFNALLLGVGAIFDGVWSCTIWGRFYDSTDYVFDFTPFWPITQGIIDRPWGNERGQLLGISLFQLQLIWLVFALGVWTTTIFLYRLAMRKRAATTLNIEPETLN